jgi:hypothetical protein
LIKKNAFLIEINDSHEKLAFLLDEIYHDKYDLNSMAFELKKEVLNRFDIKKTVDAYIKLI